MKILDSLQNCVSQKVPGFESDPTADVYITTKCFFFATGYIRLKVTLNMYIYIYIYIYV